MTEPEHVRISDEERHAVAERLRVAAGEGRLDLEELDERLEVTYAARTYADLVPITADLPSATTPARVGPRAVEPTGEVRTPVRHVAILGRLERRGVWTVPERLTVTCVMGGAELDLREARFAAREVVITINAIMGGAQIVVGPHVDVVIEGTGIMGGYSGPSGLVEAAVGADSPVLRVRGVAIMGGGTVERKHGGSSDKQNAPHRLH